MTNQNPEPGPGRSTADTAFNAIKKGIAERDERAHKAASKLRLEKDRKRGSPAAPAGLVLAPGDHDA